MLIKTQYSWQSQLYPSVKTLDQKIPIISVKTLFNRNLILYFNIRFVQLNKHNIILFKFSGIT